MTNAHTKKHVVLIWIEAFRAAVTGQSILFLAFTAGCIGLYYGRALLSIFTGIIFGVTALNLVINRRWFAELKSYTPLLALMAIILVYVLSFLHSDDVARWYKLTWDNTLFILVPLGFYAYRRESSSTWRRLIMLYVGISALSALHILLDYAMHFEEYNALYRIGKTIPTPVIHVRYSYFMALAACLAISLAFEDYTARKLGMRFRVMLGCGAFLVIFVHVLAVRTGLISLYGGLVAMWLCLVFRDGKWRLGMLSFISLIVVVMIAYNAFPSIANKIGYVMYDLKTLKEEGAQSQYSDNVRITSIRHGLHLLNVHPVTGSGIGDLDADMHQTYAERSPEFPVEDRYPPISQYVFTFAAFGIVGGLLYFLFLLFPLFRAPFNYAILATYATTCFASIGETTIELQLGKTAFLTLACIGIMYAYALRQQNQESEEKRHDSLAV